MNTNLFRSIGVVSLILVVLASTQITCAQSPDWFLGPEKGSERLKFVYYTGEEETEYEIDSSAALKTYALSTLVEISSDISVRNPLCTDVSEIKKDRKSSLKCFAALLGGVVDGHAENGDRGFLQALTLLGTELEVVPKFRKLLIGFARVGEEEVALTALHLLEKGALSIEEQSSLQFVFTHQKPPIVRKLISLFAQQPELTGLSSYQLMELAGDYNGIFYPDVVNALTNYSALSFEHAKNEIYNEDPLMRAALLESLWNRNDFTLEDEIISGMKYSIELVATLMKISSDKIEVSLRQLAHDFRSVRSSYRHIRYGKKSEVIANEVLRKLIYNEELAVKRSASVLFKIGTDTAFIAASRTLPLFERELSGDNIAAVASVVHFLCDIPDISIDFRREPVFQMVYSRSVDARAALRCLGRYSDPKLFAVYYSALQSKVDLLQRESLLLISELWWKLPSDQQESVCKYLNSNKKEEYSADPQWRSKCG